MDGIDSPPHLAHEWEALTMAEQRDVLRWASRALRTLAPQILRAAAGKEGV